jgi:hypothetical protein
MDPFYHSRHKYLTLGGGGGSCRSTNVILYVDNTIVSLRHDILWNIGGIRKVQENPEELESHETYHIFIWVG